MNNLHLTCTIVFILLLSFIVKAQPEDSTLQKTLKVGVKHTPPFIFSDNGKYSGVSVDLWNNIASELNVNYEYQELSLPGLISALETNEIDICINPLTVTGERYEKFDFSQAFYTTNLSIAVNQKDESGIWVFINNFFSKSFFEAVFLLFIVIFIFGFILWLVEKSANPKQFGNGIKGLWSGVWWSAVTMTTVGYGDKAPATVVGKFIAMIWMFTAIIIISGFTGSISSALTVDKLNSNINSLNDLKKFKTGTVKESSGANYLIDNDINFKAFTTIEEAMTALENKEITAFVYDEPILRYYVAQDQYKNVKLLPLKLNTQYYSFALTLNNPILRNLNLQLLKELESKKWLETLAKYNLNSSK